MYLLDQIVKFVYTPADFHVQKHLQGSSDLITS